MGSGWWCWFALCVVCVEQFNETPPPEDDKIWSFHRGSGLASLPLTGHTERTNFHIKSSIPTSHLLSPRRKKSSRSGLGGNNNSLERMKETQTRHTIPPPQNISMVKSELRRRCSRKGPSFTSLLAQFGSSVLSVRSIPFCILRSIHPFFSWLLWCGFFCSESRPEHRERDLRIHIA